MAKKGDILGFWDELVVHYPNFFRLCKKDAITRSLSVHKHAFSTVVPVLAMRVIYHTNLCYEKHRWEVPTRIKQERKKNEHIDQDDIVRSRTTEGMEYDITQRQKTNKGKRKRNGNLRPCGHCHRTRNHKPKWTLLTETWLRVYPRIILSLCQRSCPFHGNRCVSRPFMIPPSLELFSWSTIGVNINMIGMVKSRSTLVIFVLLVKVDFLLIDFRLHKKSNNGIFVVGF